MIILSSLRTLNTNYFTCSSSPFLPAHHLSFPSHVSSCKLSKPGAYNSPQGPLHYFCFYQQSSLVDQKPKKYSLLKLFLSEYCIILASILFIFGFWVVPPSCSFSGIAFFLLCFGAAVPLPPLLCHCPLFLAAVNIVMLAPLCSTSFCAFFAHSGAPFEVSLCFSLLQVVSISFGLTHGFLCPS